MEGIDIQRLQHTLWECKYHIVFIPKYPISNVVGYIKGKSSIYIARYYKGKQRNYAGERFWARGYYVSTVGRDEELIRRYIQDQEKADKHSDQIPIWR
jgi:putative transposase